MGLLYGPDRIHKNEHLEANTSNYNIMYMFGFKTFKLIKN